MVVLCFIEREKIIGKLVEVCPARVEGIERVYRGFTEGLERRSHAIALAVCADVQKSLNKGHRISDSRTCRMTAGAGS